MPSERTSGPPAPPPDVPAAPAAEQQRDRSLRLEIFLAAALGLAAIVTAWASFRSALVEDEMIVNFNQGIRVVDEAGQAHRITSSLGWAKDDPCGLWTDSSRWTTIKRP